jgi:hypothetical protein
MFSSLQKRPDVHVILWILLCTFACNGSSPPTAFYECLYEFSVYIHIRCYSEFTYANCVFYSSLNCQPNQSFLKLLTWMSTLLYFYTFFIYFLILNLLHLYTSLVFLDNLLVYAKPLNSLAGLGCYWCGILFSCNT